MLRGAVIVALGLVCCSAVSADGEWTEQQVQQSKQWKDARSPLILTKSGSLPDSYLQRLLEAVRGSKVTHFKVLCENLPETGKEEVCNSLTEYHVAVRSGGIVEGVPVINDSDAVFVSSVLEFLLSSFITKLWSYSDLTKYSAQYPQHLLTVTPNSEEYAALLSAMLVNPLPLGVAMTAGVLPLSQRGKYSPPPSLLRLWYIVQGKHWFSNQDMSGFNLQVVQKCKTPGQLIREFVERVHHPIVTLYKDDDTLRRQFSDSGLHMVIVFPGQSGPDAESVAVSVAQDTFMNYAFVIMPDRSRLRRFVVNARPSIHIMVLPYGEKKDLLRFLVEGTYLVHEVQHIIYSLRTHAVEKPRSKDGAKVYASLGPSMTTVSEIQKSVLATKKHHLFAYFCLEGSQRCVQVGYKVVREVLSVVRVTDLGRTLAAHVVIYKTAKTKPFKLKNLTTCALYNSTTKSWTVATGNISTGSEALWFISEQTGRRELAEVARAMIHATLTLAEVPPPPKPLHEDDTFGLVAESMPDPVVPKDIQLNSYNFEENITKFDKTAVVFCVRWSIQCKVFLHQTIAAHNQLQISLYPDLNVSLAVVGCENYTELCTRYGINTYPTVLLFTPSTVSNPTPLPGVLDPTQLLAAFSQTGEDERDPLMEVTPKSLPILLSRGAGLDTTLVLWCDEDVSTDMAETFVQQASNNSHANLVFAWMNSTNHSYLLSHILPDISTFPVVVALNFKQHRVYLLAVEQSRELSFDNKLSTFVQHLQQGILEAYGHLPNKMWSPLQPPIPFPSTNQKSKASNYPNSDDPKPSSAHKHLHTEL